MIQRSMLKQLKNTTPVSWKIREKHPNDNVYIITVLRRQEHNYNSNNITSRSQFFICIVEDKALRLHQSEVYINSGTKRACKQQSTNVYTTYQLPLIHQCKLHSHYSDNKELTNSRKNVKT